MELTMTMKMKILVLTGYDQKMNEVGRRTTPGKQAYALRHGYDFECVREFRPGSHPSWQKLRLFQERLPHYDAVIWMDADAIVTNPLIRVEDLAGPTAFTASEDYCAHGPGNGHHCFNCGIFIFRNTPEAFELLEEAAAMTQYANRKLWEQSALRELSHQGWAEHMTILPRRALSAAPAQIHPVKAVEPWEEGDFIAHLLGVNNQTRLKCLRRYPRAAIRQIAPPRPEGEHLYDTDTRHAAWLLECLRARRWGRTLEIGTYRGVTAGAFAQAWREGFIGEPHLCDLRFLPETRAFLDTLETPFVLHAKSSLQVLAEEPPYDFVFVDGHHGIQQVEKEWAALQKKPPLVIAAHDVTARLAGHKGCAGPSFLWQQVQLEGWLCLVDARPRCRERTDRGFLVATRDLEIYHQLRRAYQVVNLS